jgi:hypothetical protein
MKNATGFKNVLIVSLATICATLAGAQSQAQTKSDPLDETYINPMTGKSVTEEELQRELEKAKLRSQIYAERVRQNQAKSDLGSSGSSKASVAVPAIPLNQTLKSNEKVVKGAKGRKTGSKDPSSAFESTVSAAAQPPVSAPPQPSPVAKGTLKIGGEVVALSTNQPAGVGRVLFVDDDQSMGGPSAPKTGGPSAQGGMNRPISSTSLATPWNTAVPTGSANAANANQGRILPPGVQ